jgi:hypothetical protein
MHFGTSREETAYSVACLGLEWRVELSLKSLLGLLKDRMPVSWRHSDDINADVIVYNPASPLAQALLRREGGAGRRRVMVPCSAADPGPTGLALPIGASRLLSCLEGAAARLGMRSVAQRGESSSLCQRLDDALRERSTVGVMLTMGEYRGLLDPVRQVMHWPSELDADTISRLVLEEVAVEPLRAGEGEELRRIMRDALQPVGWDAPLWAMGISTSRGRLLGRLDARRAYRLGRWPDFGVVGRSSSDLKCAALLTQKDLSPEALVSMTGLPATRVYGFINACALCGLLEEAEAAQPAAPPPVQSTSFAGGMLQRIRKAFSLGMERA